MGASLFLSHTVLTEEFVELMWAWRPGGGLSEPQRTSLMVQASHMFVTRRLESREGM